MGPYPEINKLNAFPLALRIHDNKNCGVYVSEARGFLGGCELWANGGPGGVCPSGVFVEGRGDPVIVACKIRDHATCGIFVRADSRGCTSVGPDCIYERNAEGDVVRE